MGLFWIYMIDFSGEASLKNWYATMDLEPLKGPYRKLEQQYPAVARRNSILSACNVQRPFLDIFMLAGMFNNNYLA